ncbi:uncharacterized protein EHS24_007009 [Apiotrichum porosum]|uniref:ER membrane protein complex subunit 7 beta-sandwich domain-containing protein n=1 Tax=Apiotrichum porosum TaxID=105984 RepID=A0A427XX11_9TREE|nr:uncharacterized protein EHS24_007009 [Apiotrichum porosum]RSH83331.1 hypothetical protein EHS24_007009 [Apiotrichum porosum]
MHAAALLLLASRCRPAWSPGAQPSAHRVDLDYGASSTLFRVDGSFELFDVAPGQHLIRPIVPGYAMSSLVVTVPAEAGEALHVQSFFPDRAILPTTSPSLSYPLEVAANGPEDYFTPPPGVNLIAMFKSPMVMMMLFSAVMAIALPKITASMEDDPEVKAEMDAQRKRMAKSMDWSGSLSGKLASAGSNEAGSGSSTPAAVKAAPAPARGAQNKRGGKRR